MPELPEVQNVVDSLRPLVCGRKIQHINVLRQDVLTPPDAQWHIRLVGRCVQNISRRGKRIYIQLNDGNWLFVHLGMTGRLRLVPDELPLERHTHLAISFRCTPTVSLRFIDARRFGGVFWVGKACGDESLGPEPLELPWKELAQRLRVTSRMVKAALLDQRVVAGLGNIYVDEALHRAGIRPTRVAKRLTDDEVRQISTAIRTVLKRAIAAGGSTLRDYVNAEGTPGSFQTLHRVYGRESKPCRRCKTRIRRIVLGGRSTHFCPACQSTRAGGKSKVVEKAR
jgi:formamidopyrimidine-DNA glycosylase